MQHSHILMWGKKKKKKKENYKKIRATFHIIQEFHNIQEFHIPACSIKSWTGQEKNNKNKKQTKKQQQKKATRTNKLKKKQQSKEYEWNQYVWFGVLHLTDNDLASHRHEVSPNSRELKKPKEL